MLLLLISLPVLMGLETSHGQELFDVSNGAGKSQSGVVSIAHDRALGKQFPTLSMLAQYRGEEKRGVKYFSQAERQSYRVYYCGERLCNLQGLPLNSGVNSPLSRPKEFPKIEEGKDLRKLGLAIYVMDENGELWVSFDAKKRALHHSSLLAGAPVSAAGEMIIFNGVLYGINNFSGHYHPPPIVIDRVLDVLKSRGIPTVGLLIKRFGSDF